MSSQRTLPMSNSRSRGYGDGTIIRLGHDRYRIQVSGGQHPVTGRRIRLSGHASTMEEARRTKAVLLAQRHQPGRVVPSDRGVTVSGWLDRFIEAKRDNERTHYFRIQKAAPVRKHLGSKRLHRLTAADVHKLVNQTLCTTLSPRTRHHVLSVLSCALRAAMRDPQVRLAVNVAEGVTVKGIKDDPFEARILNDQEYESFLDAAQRFDAQLLADPRGRPCIQMEAAWVLLCERGLRSGELLGLRIKDIHLDTNQIDIRQQVQRKRGGGSTKGKPRLDGANLEVVALKTKSSKRTLKLTRRSAEALRRHFAHLDRLAARLGRPDLPWNPLGLAFPTISGNPMQGSALLHSHFRPVCELGGIQYRDADHPDGFRIHDARHTCATRHLKKHKNIVLTKALLGHASLTTTMLYAQLVPLDEEESEDE